MGWLRRHAVWAWPAVVIFGLALVLLARLLPTWTGRLPSVRLMTESSGLVAAQSADLASVARRVRSLRDDLARIHHKLAALRNETSLRQERVATLEKMLADDTLTQAPAFLCEDTTVRALQQIIREASNPAVPDQDRLNTAAAVARQRLRQKLEGIRNQLVQEVADRSAEADILREQLHLRTVEIERLQQQINRQLHAPPTALPDPSSSEEPTKK